MGVFVIVAYKPRKGKAKGLITVVRKHLKVLWKEGLATKRPPYVMRAKDGTIVEVFEWVSEKAVARAHRNPAVLALWKEFEAVCTYQSLSTLKESREMFAHFEPVKV